MQHSSRHLTLPLLVAFAMSFAATSLHAATHVSSASVDCEFCSGYSDPPDCIAKSEAQLLLVPGSVMHSADNRVFDKFRREERQQARGPPEAN